MPSYTIYSNTDDYGVSANDAGENDWNGVRNGSYTPEASPTFASTIYAGAANNGGAKSVYQGLLHFDTSAVVGTQSSVSLNLYADTVFGTGGTWKARFKTWSGSAGSNFTGATALAALTAFNNTGVAAPTASTYVALTQSTPGVALSSTLGIIVYDPIQEGTTPPSGNNVTIFRSRDAGTQHPYLSITTTTSTTLTPSLVTNSNSFHAPTVSRGPVTLTPGLFISTPTFHAPTVTRGSVTVAPPLLVSGQAFYGPTVTTSGTMAPPLMPSATAFFGPAVTPGPVTLSAALFSPGQGFHSPLISTGAVTISPSRVGNAASLFAPSVLVGAVTLSPPAIPGAGVVFAAAISSYNQLRVPLIPEGQTFFAATLVARRRQKSLGRLYRQTRVRHIPVRHP